MRSRPRRASGSGSLPAGPKRDSLVPWVAVGDLWHELALHTGEYATFCQSAFGRLLPGAETISAITSTSTRSTWPPSTSPNATKAATQAAPVAFPGGAREMAIAGGRTYLADCGGRGKCFPVSGAVCLQHLGGAGKPLRSGWGAKLDAHRDNEGPRGFDGGGEWAYLCDVVDSPAGGNGLDWPRLPDLRRADAGMAISAMPAGGGCRRDADHSHSWPTAPQICSPLARYRGMTTAQAKSVGGLAEPAGEVVVQVLLIVADPGDVAVGA